MPGPLDPNDPLNQDPTNVKTNPALLDPELQNPSPDSASPEAHQRIVAPIEFDRFLQSLLGGFPSSSGGGGSAAAKNAALKQLDIQKRRLEFQQKTGLRDIKQARTDGLKKAINNALQRGIFNSGIRVENEKTVNRESDEARDDLKTQIGLALEELDARKAGVRAGGGGGVGGSAGANISPALLNQIGTSFLGNSTNPFAPTESATAAPEPATQPVSSRGTIESPRNVTANNLQPPTQR